MKSSDLQAGESLGHVKHCARCDSDLPITLFRWTREHGLLVRQRDCNACHYAQQRARVLANPEKYERMGWNSYLKKNFKMTADDYDRLFARQNGLCACCGLPESVILKSTGRPRRLAVDHDHITGRIRALLCSRCNFLVVSVVELYGHLLDKAKDYLEAYRNG